MLQRAQAVLAALWGGLLLCVAGLAAPNAFAVLERAQAAAYVSRLFSLEAHTSLALALILILMSRRMARDGEGPTLSLELLLPVAAMFCTVLGYFALQPMMAEARAGQGALSFGALHGISLALFGLKTVLILALAWRLSARR